MPRTPRPSASRGFTLVELLISLIVLTVGILAVARMFPTGARAQTQDRLLTGANNYARESLENLSALSWSDPALTLGQHPGAGASEALGSAGQWQRSYVVSAMSAPLDHLKRVDVTVSYTGAGLGGARTVVATTYLRK